MTSTEKRYYEALRRIWHEPANRALEMARDRVTADAHGITFDWQPEPDNPRDVYGEPSHYECESCGATFPYRGDCPQCDKPRVVFHYTGVYFDPDAEFWTCVAKDEDGNVLDSLSMIDGAWDRTDYAGYWFLVECQMASEALSMLEPRRASEDIASEERLC